MKNIQKRIKNICRFLSVCFILLIVFALTFCKKNKTSEVQSEYFTKFFGSSGLNQGSDVCQTKDGGYIVLGTTSISGKGSDILLIKTDKYGNTEWSKTYGDSLNDFAKSIRITSDDGYAILGTTTSYIQQVEQTDMYFIKTDNRGNEIWNKKIGGEYNQEGNCVQQLSDNGFILVGSTTEPNPTNNNPAGVKDILFVTIDASGNLEKKIPLGGPADDVGNFVQQKPDNGFVIIGSTESYTEGGKFKSNIIILETKKNGNVLDAPLFGEMYDDYGECIQKLTDNSYIITGTTTNSDNTSNFYIVKLGINNVRIPVWIKSIETGFGNTSKFIYPTNDNGFILTGTSSKDGSNSIGLIKISSDGNTVFSKYFGLVSADVIGNCVKQTSDGGFIIVGTNSYEGPSMITLIKTNSSGNQK